jgi:regulator of Ty1 transposition protein 109
VSTVQAFSRLKLSSSTAMSSPSSSNPSRSAIASAISELLPKDLTISLYHLATTPAKTSPLFTPAPGKKPANTTLESHFIAISHDSILVFAIELLVYTLVATGERIIFVSKADSSGYLPSSAASYVPADSESRVSLVKTVATTAIRTILEGAQAANPHAKVTLSLFARSQTQYLFPNSAANKKKHVLEDRGLIAWWCRVFDPIFQQRSNAGAKAYLLVPGFDRLQTRKLFPPRGSNSETQWIDGHPLVTDPKRDLTVREVIPHFPDDPKARFLDELMQDEEDTGKKKTVARRGKSWGTVPNLESFWEMMSMRQECSLGRCVGFIWVVIEGEPKKAPKLRDTVEPETPVSPQAESPITQMTEPAETTQTIEAVLAENQNVPKTETTPTESNPTETTPPTTQEPTKKLTLDTNTSLAPSTDSPVLSPKKRFHSDTVSILLSPRKKKLKTLEAELSLKPPLVAAPVVLDEKRYTRTIDSLLNHSDFGTAELAKEGSKNWIRGSYAVVKSSNATIRDGWDWGEVITGTREKAAEEKKATSTDGIANVLQVRKKKKDEPTVLNAGLIRKKEKPAENAPAVNVLGAGMIRKKAKPTEPEPEPTPAPVSKEPAVNMLGAGLIRKKPKAEESKPEGEKVEETKAEA